MLHLQTYAACISEQFWSASDVKMYGDVWNESAGACFQTSSISLSKSIYLEVSFTGILKPSLDIILLFQMFCPISKAMKGKVIVE